MRVGGDVGYIEGIFGVTSWSLHVGMQTDEEQVGTSCSGGWPIIRSGLLDWEVEAYSNALMPFLPGERVRFNGMDLWGNQWVGNAVVWRVEVAWESSGLGSVINSGVVLRGNGALEQRMGERGRNVGGLVLGGGGVGARIDGREVGHVMAWGVALYGKRDAVSWCAGDHGWPRRAASAWGGQLRIEVAGVLPGVLSRFDNSCVVELLASDYRYFFSRAWLVGMRYLCPNQEREAGWRRLTGTELRLELSGPKGMVTTPYGRTVWA